MGLIKTAGKVAVASAVHGRVQRRQQLRWAAQDNAQVSTQPAASGGDPQATQLAHLAQLGELRAAGILTEAEFQAKKATILRS
jgi:hypothetical protein